MSDVAAGRRGVPRRVRYLLRRAGRVLWFLLKGAGLGLGWCVAMLAGFAALMIAAQPDAIFSPFLANHTAVDAGGLTDHRGPLMMARAMFMVFAGIGFLAMLAASKGLENWWGANSADESVLSASTARPSGDQTLRHTRRVLGTTWTVLLMLAVGVGFGWGGCVLVGNAADVLTSDDAAVLRHAAETALSRADFTPRGMVRENPPRSITPKEMIEGEREEALVHFGLGLFITSISLFAFAGAYFEVAEAIGFYRDRDDDAQ